MTDTAPNILERAIATVSPSWALSRQRARAERGVLTNVVPYGSAYQTRTDSYWALSMSMTGIREINRFNLRRMRDRARHLERENVLACAILDRCCDNVIGTGLRLMPSTPDEEFNQQILDLWEPWKDRAELTGRFDFAQLQHLLYRSHLRDGDVGGVLVADGDDGYFQAVSGDYIDSNAAVLDNLNHVHGMKLGANGRVEQYTIKTASTDGAWQETNVPARSMIFYPRSKQMTDYRGEPLFAPLFELLEQMDKYKEATVIKKRLEVCQGVIIKKNAAVQAMGALPSTTNAQAELQKTLNVEPGMIHYLNPGEDVEAFSPSTTEQTFEGFMKSLAGFLGLNCGLTVSMLMMDYTGQSYTSGKAGNLQSNRHFRIEQERFANIVLRRLYLWRLAKWVRSGQLRVPAGMESSYWQHLWIPNGFPLLDPNREIAAQMAEIDAGLGTYSDIALSRGHIFSDLCDRRRRDDAMLKAAGIVPSRSTLTRDALVAGDGAATASPRNSDADNEDSESEIPAEA